MPILFNKFGPAGTLNSYLDFPTWNGNGVQGLTSTPEVQAAIGDRANVVVLGGEKALVIKRYAGDPMAGSGHRSELTPDNYSHVMDWIGEGVAFATEAAATRQYRVRLMVPSSQNVSWVGNTTGPSAVLFQLHQVPDDSPADIEGGQPALSVQVRRAGNVYRLAVLRNVDPTPTITVDNPALQSKESVSWPFEFDREYDIHVAVKWSYGALGNMVVYLDRHPVFIESGVPNCPNNSPARGGAGMYPKFGAYIGPDYDFTVVHRGIIVGDGVNFAEMYPELSANAARPLERVARHASALGTL